MNPFEKIPEQEINHFKEKVQLWVNVDVQIEKLEKQLKDLKKVRDKELEPEITKSPTISVFPVIRLYPRKLISPIRLSPVYLQILQDHH